MIIRSAMPADVHDIAELIYSSGVELYDFVYRTPKHNALDYIRHEFLSGRGLCGHQNVTVAEKNGRVVATGCFYDGRAYPGLMAGSFANMLGYFGVTGIVPALWRANHVSSVMKPPKRDELYLANFGVAETERGTGIGSAMLEAKIAEARTLGYRVFALDVADTNPRAEKLYRRHGLEQVAYKQFSGKRDGIAVPNSRKMEMVLQAA